MRTTLTCAAHADRLIAFSGWQDTVACATELPQDDVVAAIQQKSKQQSRNHDRVQKSPSHRRYRPALPAAKAARRRHTVLLSIYSG